MSEMLILKAMVRGVYDLQDTRMRTGLRLSANFRARLKAMLPPDEPDNPDEIDAQTEMDARAAEKKRVEKEALKVVKILAKSYRRLCDGIARNRTLPAEKGFIGDEIIHTHTELVLVDQYMALVAQEDKGFRQLEGQLEHFPIYQYWLEQQVGVGPAMGGVLITSLDPYKARTRSSYWSYTGVDVAWDGRGRSWRQEHLVEREYTDKRGKPATRMGVTYNPWVKTKLTGVLAGSFLRTGSPWRRVYDDYKHRLVTDPSREKCTVTEWKKRFARGEEVKHLWTPGRINTSSKRYMLKMFLGDYWLVGRIIEGLPITNSYHEGVMGHVHGGEPGWNGPTYGGVPKFSMPWTPPAHIQLPVTQPPV